MSARLRWAILALPLLGLGAGWLATHRAAQQGIDWDVPVAGFDPRDWLRGHYVLYRYEWPGLARPDRMVDGSEVFEPIEALCLEGEPPVIERASRLDEVDSEGDERDGAGDATRCTSIARTSARDRSEAHGLESGLYYVGQDRALALQARLADPSLQATIRIRVRADGVVRPLEMTFAPRE